MSQNPLEKLRRRPVPERRTFPDPEYAETVLRPMADVATRLLEQPAVRVHRARIIDLVEVRSLPQADGVAALAALDELSGGESTLHHPLDHIEQALEGVGGSALLGSAPEEISVAAMRMVLRERLVEALETLLELRATLTTLAQGHLHTLMTITSIGQMVQPTTLAHYLTGYFGPLGRATERYKEAFARLNRSPLGSVSGVASAVPVRRERVSSLLGFDGLLAHTFDALASSDTEFELVAIVAGTATELQRLVADLSEWARDDTGTVVPGEEFVHQGTAQPQRRDPLVLDHLRVRFSEDAASLGRLGAILAGRAMMTGTATRFETFRVVETTLTEASEHLRLLSRVLSTLEVNRALAANRAHRGFATSSELADLLAVDGGLPRTEAYALANRIATEAMILNLGGMTLDTKLVDKLALEVIGREVGIEPETLGTCLSVKRFIERREVVGGPAPSAVNDTIEREELARQRVTTWVETRRSSLDEAQQSLDAAVESLRSGSATGRAR